MDEFFGKVTPEEFLKSGDGTLRDHDSVALMSGRRLYYRINRVLSFGQEQQGRFERRSGNVRMA